MRNELLNRPALRLGSMLRLDDVALRRLEVLEREEAPADWVYFPLDCVISLVKTMRDGRSIEVATIGNEGSTAASFVVQPNLPLGRLVVQASGRALRMRAEALRELLEDHPDARACLERYAQALIAQIVQSAACNQLHSAFERCARQMLTMRDRRGETAFAMTHECLAEMLGVRRATVTEAARRLKDQGAIAYRRGRIEIADEAALERASCECHAVVAETYERLLNL